MDNLFFSGTWINSWQKKSFSPPYSTPCVFEHPNILKYVAEDCSLSNANVGSYYSWKPQNGNLAPWNPAEMCAVANGRNILFVGDSLQQEFYFEFVSAALATTAASDGLFNSSNTRTKRLESAARCEKLCDWGKDCRLPVVVDCINEPSFTMNFERSNHLDGFVKNYKLRSEAGAIMSSLARHNISLILMSTGTHYQKDDELLKNLNASLSLIYEHHPLMSIIFRNTFTGHENCAATMRSSPLENTPSERERVNRKSLVNPQYNWYLYQTQNALVKEFLSVYFPMVFFIDIATSTNLRIDSHVSKNDCLHYCMPGPISEWVVFHFNALLRISNTSILHEVPSLPKIKSTFALTDPFHIFNTSISSLLYEGEIFKSDVSHLSLSQHYLYINSSKIYISISDLPIYLQLLNKSVNLVKSIPYSNAIRIKTKKWSL